MTNVYRRIYQKYHGVIPKDENGRTFDIHHIDGDRNNNDISNLIAVSIDEHYRIHYQQQDWYACYLIAKKMKKTKEELSELSRKCQQEKVKNGTHPWQDKEWHRKIEKDKVAKGVHPFLGGEISKRTTAKRLADGTHNFLNNQNSKRFWKNVDDDTRNELTSIFRETQKKRIKSGEHPFLGSGQRSRERNQKLLKEGKHFSQITHVCPHCNHSGHGNSMKRWHFDNCKNRKD